LISERALLGTALRISTVPAISPAGVVNVIVPVINRDFSFS
jgi:hypothetical protein